MARTPAEGRPTDEIYEGLINSSIGQKKQIQLTIHTIELTSSPTDDLLAIKSSRLLNNS